jgi:DnaD/phage-associated family protein
MAELAYIKLWAEFEKYFGVLGAVEVGRLILGAQEYAFHGTEPQFTGSERILWPVLKESIDKDKAYNEKQQSNGSKGGRPKKTNETQQNPEKPNETQDNPEKPHIVNRKQKTENIITTTTTTAHEEPETENLKCCVSCYEQNIGAINRAVFDEIRAQLKVVEPDLICEAIRQAGLNNKPSWKYIAAILNDCAKHNILTRDAFLLKESTRAQKAQPTRGQTTRRKTAQEEFLEMAKGGVPGGQAADSSTFGSSDNLLAEY